jgi:hypothetical protein
VITFIDLAGHEKYLKTTVFGMTGHAPGLALFKNLNFPPFSSIFPPFSPFSRHFLHFPAFFSIFPRFHFIFAAFFLFFPPKFPSLAPFLKFIRGGQLYRAFPFSEASLP